MKPPKCACFVLMLVSYWLWFTNICCVEDANEVEQDLTNDELAQYDPPEKKILKILRIREIRRRQTIKLFTDLCVYVILLAMVMILSFQYRNPDSYKMINTLRRVFVDPIHNSSRVRFDQVRMWYFTYSTWGQNNQKIILPCFVLWKGSYSKC